MDADYLPASADNGTKTRYLNLRYANLRVDPVRYAWTKFEAHLLRWHKTDITPKREYAGPSYLLTVSKAPVLRNPTVDATEKGSRSAKRTASSRRAISQLDRQNENLIRLVPARDSLFRFSVCRSN